MAKLVELHGSSFAVAFDAERGIIASLRHARDTFGTNFVIGPGDVPEFDVEDSRWLGDLRMGVLGQRIGGVQTMRTGLSKDSRTTSHQDDTFCVRYTGQSKEEHGIRGISVRQDFQLRTEWQRDELKWTIELCNLESRPLQVEDLGMSLLMNSFWKGDQTGIYEQNVSRHSFVGQHGSYIYWQRPNGTAPFLVLMPTGDTRFEYKDKTRVKENAPCAEIHPKWEGVCEFFVHSKNVSQIRKDFAVGYLPSSSRTLAPGETATYSFAFRWANSFADLRDIVYECDGLDVVSLPGMVIPSDMTATLALRAKGGVRSVSGEHVIAKRLRESGEHEVWELRILELGAKLVTVDYGASRQSVLQFYSIGSIESIIKARSEFLVTNQLARSDRGYNGAFLQWDMVSRKLITWDDYPGGGWKEWMCGGSDDLGLAPAAFFGEKNLVYPIQREVTAIEEHVDNFLLGYLQNARDSAGKRTWQVYRWFDGQDGEPYDKGVWRAYNYTHIANTYFALYKIGNVHSRIRLSRKPVEYLCFCWNTLIALFTKIALPNPIGNAAYEMGLMGESTYPEILEALERECMSDEAQQLRGYIKEKYHHFRSQKYPFASEMSIDTTGFEACYTLANMFGDRDLIEKVQHASMACRGMQPIWYFYGGDNRSMGESWWNLGYETQLGAWQQNEYLVKYSNPSTPDLADMVRSTYGAYLGGWANVNLGQIDSHPDNHGAAAWVFQSEGGTTEFDHIRSVNGWWMWSGEAELGFWGAMRTASVMVVEDPVVGLYAYGGQITTRNESGYTFRPLDGVRNRFSLLHLRNLNVRLVGCQYIEARVELEPACVTVLVDGSVGSSGARITMEVNWSEARVECQDLDSIKMGDGLFQFGSIPPRLLSICIS